MSRQETIEIKLIYDAAKESLKTLKGQADELKKTLSAVNIGDSKSYATIAKAEKDLATAAMNRAKAEKLSADAITAKMKAEKAASVTATAKLKQDQQAAKTSADQAKADLANAKTKTQLAKAETEIAKAESIRTRQTILLTREQERQSAAMRRLGQDIGHVNASQAQSIQYMSQWIRQQEGLSNATVHATGAINNANGSFQTYRAAVSEAGGATHNYRMAVNTATGEVYQLDQGIRTTSVSLRDMSSILRAVRTVVGFTGIAQSMRSAFTEMKSMSDELVTYRKVTGATAQEMERIRSSAYETSKRYGQTPSDFLAQAATMARAGYGQNATAMAELATKTQLVGDMTADAASKFLIAVDAAYQFGGSVEKLTSILDGANTIDNNYATTIEKISEGMTLTASLASSAHVPVEQLTAALGVMTAVTQRSGSETARGLRQIMLNIIGDTTTEIEEGVTVAEEEMSAMQQALMRYTPEVVKAAQATGKLINPMEAIAALAKQYKEGLLTEAELFGITESIGGKRYYNVFTALIQNYDMYEEMLGKVMQSTGSADAEVAAMLDGWTAKANQLSATWTQVVNNTVSENFIKWLIDGATAALEFAGNLENLAMVAGGAAFALRSLTHGGSGFVTIASLAVSAIGAYKTYIEYQKRSAIESAQESAKTTKEILDNTTSITKAIGEYKEITKDGIIDTTELSEAQRIQENIKKLIGEQADSYDLLNGKVQENIALITSASIAYLQSQLSEAKVQVANTASSLKTSVGNGTFNSPSVSTGALAINEDKRGRAIQEYIEEELSKYSSKLLVGGKAQTRLGVFSVYSTEEIVAFYEKLKGLQSLFAELYNTEELSSDKAYSSINDVISTLTPAVSAYTEALQNQYGVEANLLLLQNGFLDKKFESKSALDAYIKSLAEENNLTENQTKALSDMAKALADVEKAADGGTGSFEDATKSAYGLADAIDAATDAKTRFDDAMKTSKADAFNDYVKAFQTLQGEIDAGRVNSTAFYASARMLLGDEAYNATGGSTEAVMAALNRAGRSGSAMQAYDILSATYKNAEGTAIEGYGAYELLTRTRGYEGKLTNENGMPYIPELSQSDMEAISKEWGDLSTEYLQHFFTAALNAFDQYDITGEATDAAVQAAKTGEANAEAEQSTRKAAEGMDMVYEADGKLAQATEEAAETVTEFAEAASEAASEAADETGGEGEGTETPKVVTPDTEQARKDAEDWLAILDDIEAAYTRINEMSVGANPDLEALFADIDKLRETITLNIQTGAGSGTSALVAAAIAGSIATINSYAKDGKISVTVASKLTGNLNKDLISIVQNTKNLEELESIELALTANETPLDEEIAAAIAKQRENITLKVSADADQADKDIDKVADKQRTATINVKESGAATASKLIDAVANKIRTAKIAVETEESSATKQKTSTGGTGAKSSPGDSGGYSGGVSGGYGADPLNSLLDVYSGKGYASGTSSHPGGPALVNDGVGANAGPELIVQRGSAFIANRGNPAIVNLQRGAKVFTAGETREILSNGVIPSYSLGTGLFKDHPEANPSLGAWTQTTIGSFATRDNGDEKTSDSSGTSSGKSSGGSSGPKIDEKAFENLSAMVDYIIKRIGEALDEQLGIIDKQIDALKQQKDALDAQNELEEKQKAVAEAQRDLETALSERTIRYLGEDGKWHWMADARNVQTAQENLQKAQDALSEYQNKAAYEAEVAALEAQKKALQEEYTNITDAWSKIQAGVETPTGDLAEMISAVLTGGTPQQQTGANAIRDYLIGSLLTGGSYAGNYSEALDSIAKATAGSPIMPDGSGSSLAALIATGGGLTGSTAEALRVMNGGVTGSVTGAFGDGGTHINYNYFVNGMEIGAEAAQGMTLSEVMRSLTVYAGQ